MKLISASILTLSLVLPVVAHAQAVPPGTQMPSTPAPPPAPDINTRMIVLTVSQIDRYVAARIAEDRAKQAAMAAAQAEQEAADAIQSINRQIAPSPPGGSSPKTETPKGTPGDAAKGAAPPFKP